MILRAIERKHGVRGAVRNGDAVAAGSAYGRCERQEAGLARERIMSLDDRLLGRAAQLEDDAAICRKRGEQRFRQRRIVAADEGGIGRCRIGLAIVVAGLRIEQDERRRTGRRELLKRARMPRKGREMLQQDDIAERIGAEPLDDGVSVPDRPSRSMMACLSRTAITIARPKALSRAAGDRR